MPPKKKSPDKLTGREQRRLQWWQQYHQQQDCSTRLRVKTPSKDKTNSKSVSSTSKTIQNEGGFKTKLTSNIKYAKEKNIQQKNSKKNISTPQKNIKKSTQKLPLKAKTVQNTSKSNPGASQSKKKLSSAQSQKQATSQTNNGTSNTVTKSPHITNKYVLFVGNLPFDITKEKLEEHFRKTDGVKTIRIPKERGTDKIQGFAYIEFRDRISHRIGLRLHQTTLQGRKINVEFTSIGGGKSKERAEKLKAKNKKMAHFKKPLDS